MKLSQVIETLETQEQQLRVYDEVVRKYPEQLDPYQLLQAVKALNKMVQGLALHVANHANKLVVILVCVLVMGIAHAQELGTIKTLCVTWPRGNDTDARAERKAVSQYLQKLGNPVVDCWENTKTDYDAEVWFYPLSTTGVSEQTFFTAQFATAPNTVVGSFITWEPSYGFKGWTVSLWPRGRYYSIYRDTRQGSLGASLGRLSKVLHKAQARQNSAK